MIKVYNFINRVDIEVERDIIKSNISIDSSDVSDLIIKLFRSIDTDSKMDVFNKLDNILAEDSYEIVDDYLETQGDWEFEDEATDSFD